VQVLGVDPGTRKVGYAVVDDGGAVLELGIEPVETFAARAQKLRDAWQLGAIALGGGTNTLALERDLSDLGLPIASVDERETTLRARALYFADHPPRGWRRLIPLGMQLPPRPIDDYAAVLIARRYFSDEGNRTGLV
jgi:RNase H-fold protein (predicted Holliday junction resolvase)